MYEQQILRALKTAKGRGKEGLTEEQRQSIEEAVTVLEQDGGLPNPTQQRVLDGKWRLLYTSRPGTASPIQRTFTGVDAFSVYQEVDLTGDEPRVNNIVDFNSVGYLKVEAQASTDSRPLKGFTPRQDKGDFLWGLFGKSMDMPPPGNNRRIDFQFDQAAFHFSALPFPVPYPVPFRLLGDERKGWLDVTYTSREGTLRLSRGNKGTLFVLQKDIPLVEQLLTAVQAGRDEQVVQLIEELQAVNPTPSPASSPLAGGTWRLVWSQQAETASALQKFGSKQAKSFQIIDLETGSIQNLVDLGLLRITAKGQCSAGSRTRTDVDVQETGLLLGQGLLPKPLFVPLPGPQSSKIRTPGYVDWLYLDNSLRITRGNKGSVFIHVKEQ